ncbi:MAG: hypothetical protein F6K19_33835 [Cyanothece sp. SIO1E1]|nr:hypothetical protein [Cyanothece sp. SIO1E1]
MLSTLSVKELRDFQLHIDQFSDRDAIKKLLAHLSTFEGKWKHQDLQLEVVGKNLGYKAPYKSLSNRASDLHKNLMKFLVIRKLYSEDYKFEKEFLELKILEDRAVDKLKKLQRGKMTKQLEKTKVTDQWSPLRRMLMYDMAYYTMDENRIDLKKTEIEYCLKEEEHFSIGTRLKYACELLSRSQVLQESSEKNAFFDDILRLDKIQGDVFQEIYHAAFRALYLPNTQDFEGTFKILRENGSALSEKDQYTIFMYLLNSAAQRSKREVQIFGRKLLELYKFGLPKGYLTHNDQISRVNYLNILDIAYKISDFSFAKNFIVEFQSKLSKEDRLGTNALADAMLYFTKNEYGKTLEKLSTQNFRFLDEKFRSHILILCCLYELEGDSTIVWDKCKAFQTFIDRNKGKLNSNFLLSVRNFVGFIQKLLRKKHNREGLRTELKNTNNLVFRQWLEKHCK